MTIHHPEFGRFTADDGPCLRVYTLGPARVAWQGKPWAIQRRQARALLYRLAAQLQPVPHEELSFTFWPDAPESAVHRHLSALLSHLRQALPMPAVLIGTNDLVELDRDLIWCDAAEFRQAASQPAMHLPGILEQALDLYRGPFLSGFSLPDAPEFEAWAVQQRGTLQHLYLDVLAALLGAEANQSEYARAIRYAREYLRVDKLAEGVHRQLMVLHAMMGDRPAAVRQYQDCAAILERELGVAPLPATRAIYQAILQNEL